MKELVNNLNSICNLHLFATSNKGNSSNQKLWNFWAAKTAHTCLVSLRFFQENLLRGVIHLNGQMVSNSSVVNFVPESRLPFVQISFIYRKTAAEAWNWCQRWLGLKYFIRKKKQTNKTTFSDVPLLPEIFRKNEPKSRFPFTFQPDLPETSRIRL